MSAKLTALAKTSAKQQLKPSQPQPQPQQQVQNQQHNQKDHSDVLLQVAALDTLQKGIGHGIVTGAKSVKGSMMKVLGVGLLLNSKLTMILLPWAVIVLVIILLAIWFGGGSSSSTQPQQAPRTAPAAINTSVFRIPSPSFISNDKYAVARESFPAGRADQVEWYDPLLHIGKETSDSMIGFSLKTKQPSDIQWFIDPSKNEDYSQLPTKLMDIIKEKAKKMIVTIPWIKVGGLQYRPDCAAALYSDGTPASDIIRDDSTGTCILSEKSLTEYTKRLRVKRDNPGFKSLDAYGSSENANCVPDV